MKVLIKDLKDFPKFCSWVDDNCRNTCNTWEDVLKFAGYHSCSWPYSANNNSPCHIAMDEAEYTWFLLRWS